MQPQFKTLLEQGKSLIGEKEYCLGGWARSVRAAEKGSILFIQLTDGSCQTDLQVIVRQSDQHPQYDDIATGNVGWSFEVTGTFVASPEDPMGKNKKKEQEIELLASKVRILGKTTEEKPYPLQKRGKEERKKGIPIDRLREINHLKSRTYLFQGIFRLRNVLAMATHEYFQNLKCLWVSAPLITFSDCEGAGEAFVVTTDEEIAFMKEQAAKGIVTKQSDVVVSEGEHPMDKQFFKQKAFLTVSGQLEGEAAACGMSRIYTFGPTFRAEKSKTTRHLSEFWMVEPEFAFIDFEQLKANAEGYVQFCIKQALEKCSEELEMLESTFSLTKKETLEQYATKPFVRLTYTEAVDILQKAGLSVKWGDDLCSDFEKYLTDVIYKHPIIVSGYPTSLKAFYMKPDSVDGKTVDSFDLLVPTVGELIGGSMREDDYMTLKTKMEGLGMDIGPYKEYLELREFGTCKHGGYGLGFERLIKFIGGIPNIKDTIYFPRSY